MGPTGRAAMPAATRRALTAALIFLIVAGAIALTARDPGLTWDEAIYYGFAWRYYHYFRTLSAASFSADALRAVWQGGWVHPPLGKLIIAASFGLFGDAVDLISAARLGAACVFGLCAAILYLWAAARRGETVGIMAAAAFVLMPRIFAHGHFANLEMPMVLLWLAVTIAFERGVENRRWSVACGILFGLALLTKINAVFLPVVLGAWGLLAHRRRVAPNLVAMAVLGPILFFAGWPALWPAPLDGTLRYLADKAGRMIIPVHYLGTTYADRFAPFHYPFVMLLATTPLLVLAAAVVGVLSMARRSRPPSGGAAVASQSELRNLQWLVIWSFAFPLLLLALPGIPKYDGIRLMLPAYPFLALLAAEGGAWVLERMAGPKAGENTAQPSPLIRRPSPAGRRVAPVVGVLAAVWLIAPVAAFHPFQLSYYGELAGGPWGARKLGFETTYWDDTLNRDALDWLNRHLPPHANVAFVAVEERIWQWYRAMGEVREDIRIADFDADRWDYAVIIPRQGMLTESVRKVMSESRPVWTKGLPPFGTPPVCIIYAREPP